MDHGGLVQSLPEGVCLCHVMFAGRYNVKMLLSHEFFAEGVKIEALKGVDGEGSSVLTLRMEVPTKETSRKNNQESIEFVYDVAKDTPEGVVGKMVSHFNALAVVICTMRATVGFDLA